jgi:hypothetical protein
MDLEGGDSRSRPAPGVGQATAGGEPAWNWELEIAAAIAMVARDPGYRVALCARALTGRVLARLDPAAASAGVVLERRIRPGGGWDVLVRAA